MQEEASELDGAVTDVLPVTTFRAAQARGHGATDDAMGGVHQDFAFADGDRTFTCEVETPHRPDAGTWWWFRVSTEARHRYAPFRATSGDTRDDVRTRVLAYYDHLLARRAEPAVSRWRRRPAVPATPAAPTTDAPAG